ncbi:hypothetical protein [Jiulongibacter sediminis]|uniref:Lipocalin-like domain-containing protein n=1 Tax=Jiulongibacter sediminis TaxID=1605367 RepID=A0A0P7C5C2_9BACT|nr:hypothetical protein [Jiulongibacter sediminis]KPM47297.1 hypothetical protein AFM12_16015 [Jiulongibacter sediminis]TBX22855.1 hypothetical protein TK44_16025 [Jiulongibacter sediminis]
MKLLKAFSLFFIGIAVGCTKQTSQPEVQGTWQLQTGTLIENGDTTLTDYTKGQSFIKILNETHFAFLLHDLQQGKDSTSATYSAGGGTYDLDGNKYSEHLEYYSAREWEGHDFNFEIEINGDTLIQQGVEELPDQNIKRYNIEKYLRVK